jgi:hypothetical protein
MSSHNRLLKLLTTPLASKWREKKFDAQENLTMKMLKKKKHTHTQKHTQKKREALLCVYV